MRQNAETLAIELAMADDDPVETMLKFLQRGIWITFVAEQNWAGTIMGDERRDDPFYEGLRFLNGDAKRLKIQDPQLSSYKN